MGSLPTLTIDVTGRRYGGAYWNEAQYQVVFSNWHPESRLVAVTTTDGSDGAAGVVTYLTLGTNAQKALIAHQNHDDAPRLPDILEDVPGLSLKTVWQLGDDSNDVALMDSDLDEVAEWLRYATGELTWDGGDDWEY